MSSKMDPLAARTLGFRIALTAVMLSALPAHAGADAEMQGTSYQGTSFNGTGLGTNGMSLQGGS